VKAAYRKEMFLCHPDRMASRSAESQRRAHEHTLRVQNAYRSILERRAAH
jgi:preprotein translocase subunit Sec63